MAPGTWPAAMTTCPISPQRVCFTWSPTAREITGSPSCVAHAAAGRRSNCRCRRRRARAGTSAARCTRRAYGRRCGARPAAGATSSCVVAPSSGAKRIEPPGRQRCGGPVAARLRRQSLRSCVEQMIGHMVKQIMDAAGYEIDQQKVKMESIPFYAGTRYKRRDDRTYHVWHKGSDARSCALTPDKLGSKLPPLTDDRWIYTTHSADGFVGRYSFRRRGSTTFESQSSGWATVLSTCHACCVRPDAQRPSAGPATRGACQCDLARTRRSRSRRWWRVV